MKKYTRKKAEKVIKSLIGRARHPYNKPWIENGLTCVTDGNQLYAFGDAFPEFGKVEDNITLFVRQGKHLERDPDENIYYHEIDEPDYESVETYCKGWNMGKPAYIVSEVYGSPSVNPRFVKKALEVFPGARWFIAHDYMGKSLKSPIFIVHPNGRAMLLPKVESIIEEHDIPDFVLPKYREEHLMMMEAWNSPVASSADNPELKEICRTIIAADPGEKFMVSNRNGEHDIIEIGIRNGKKIMKTTRYPRGYVISTPSAVKKRLREDAYLAIKVVDTTPTADDSEGGLEPDTYKYGMRLRGFSPGCQPKDGFIERQDDPTGKYYDILIYNRELTADELNSYELNRIV